MYHAVVVLAFSVLSGEVLALDQASITPECFLVHKNSIYIPVVVNNVTPLDIPIPTVVPEYPDYACKIDLKIDKKADGSIDQVYDYYYDQHSNLMWIDRDDDGDGEFDAITRTFYNESGKKTSWYYDEHRDNKPEMFSKYLYDRDGNMIMDMQDTNGDMIIDRVTTLHYINALLARDELDEDANCSTDAVTSYTYDDKGRVLRELWDDNNDETPDSSVDFLFDGELLMRILYDIGFDSTIEMITAFEYDTQGRMIKTMSMDGTERVSSSATFLYNQMGLLDREDWYYKDSWEESWSYQYDDWGRLSQKTYTSAAYPANIQHFEYYGKCLSADKTLP